MPEIPVIRLVPLRTKVDNLTAQLIWDSAIYERTLTEYRKICRFSRGGSVPQVSEERAYAWKTDQKGRGICVDRHGYSGLPYFLEISTGSFHEPGSGFLGFIAGTLRFACRFDHGTSTVPFEGPRSYNGSSSGSSFSITSWPRLAYTMALLLVYGLLLERLGYVITTFLVMWGPFYDHTGVIWFSSCSPPLYLGSGASTSCLEIWRLCQFPRGIFPWW